MTPCSVRRLPQTGSRFLCFPAARKLRFRQTEHVHFVHTKIKVHIV